jgi:hypothetical protein
MSYRGTSRSISPITRCAVVVRGDHRCAWCTAALAGVADTTIDHVDGDHGNNRHDNLVPACWSCNSTGGNGPEALDARLHRIGVDPTEARARVAQQVAEPLDRAAGRLLAEEWYPGRLEALRNAGRERMRRLAKAKADLSGRTAFAFGANVGEAS